jgi:CubicO group peptidase (beta-lactamase class C family)
MLKLGQLYLDNGRWLGRQIVPVEYVRQSTQAYATAATMARFGYQWWFTVAQGHNGFAARGFGGQLVYVVPDLGLVVAISCRTPAAEPVETATRMEALINRVVLPALEAPSDR